MNKGPSIVLISILFAVTTSHAQSSVPGDTQITLQRFVNDGPGYKLTINFDGTVIFKRFANPFVDRSDPKAKASEPIRTKIPVKKVAALVTEFERINFFSLNDRYAKTEDGCPGVLTDQPSAETSIVMNGKTKSIAHYYGCRNSLFDPIYPEQLTAFERRIDEIVGTKQLHKLAIKQLLKQ